MRLKIIEELKKNPGVKAKVIARALGTETSEINSVLHRHPDDFDQDENYCWTLKSSSLEIIFPGDVWLDSRFFEDALVRATCPASHDTRSIVFIVPTGCKPLLISAARLMALCNQLVVIHGKDVTLQFSETNTAMRYLNRMGFFSHLHLAVIVTPFRPSVESVSKLQGQNENVVEFASIDATPGAIPVDDDTPARLRNAFVNQTSRRFFQPIFTLLAELINNVSDHSASPIPGFIALQSYGKSGRHRHIQTVISDSGMGICGTMNPILKRRYPEIAAKLKPFNEGAERNARLVMQIFEDGHISSVNKERGLGLKRTGDIAQKFNATISIRQEDFEVTLKYRESNLQVPKYRTGLVRLLGTHICVDFKLD